MLTVLEMALREVLVRTGPGARRGAVGRRARGDEGGTARSPRRARGRAPARGPRAPRRGEEEVYRRGSRTSYFADELAWTCSPTPRSGARPSARPPSASGRRGSLGVVGLPLHPLRRRPRKRGCAFCAAAQTIEWDGRDCARSCRRGALRGEAGGESSTRSGGASCCGSGCGLDGYAYRPARKGDGVTAVAAERDLPLLAGWCVRPPASRWRGTRGERRGDRRSGGPGPLERLSATPPRPGQPKS